MNAVTSAQLQQPVRFLNNPRLLLRGLHGEHGFAVDDRGRSVRQPRLFCQADYASLIWPLEKLLHQSGSVLVTFDCRVAGGLFVEDHSSGFAEARSKFNDRIGWANVQSVDHAQGQLSPARTKDTLAQTSK